MVTAYTRGCRHPASLASQAGFNEQIKHIIRKLHAVFVQPQQLQDKSLGGDVEHQMIFARPIDHIPDFDRPAVTCGHDLGAIGRKRHRVDLAPVRVSLLAQQLQFACQTSQRASVLAKEGRFRVRGAPESQTLIIPSADPETILVPSGENASDRT